VAAAGAPGDAGQSFAAHLLAWVGEHAPDYLAALGGTWRQPGGAVLAYLLRTGDAGVWLGEDYRAKTGRVLPVDTLDVLRCWVAALIEGPDQVCWLGRASGEWHPITPAQLLGCLPVEHLEYLEMVQVLRPLLRSIHAGALDFGGETHRVRVFWRAAMAEQDPLPPPPPPLPKHHPLPEEWTAGKAEAFRWLEENGAPPAGSRAATEFWRHLAGWLAAKRDVHRDPRTLRRWAARYLAAYLAEREDTPPN
jgi:hypothetical protein